MYRTVPAEKQVKKRKYFITGNPIYDGVGSVAIGALLGAVATFLVTSNVNALIGKSIPQSRLEELQEMLEDDAVVR